jgi:adenylate kinase family enzyme
MADNTMLMNPFAGQNIGYLRLAVVGDSGVGKTSFARQFTETLPEVLSHDWEPVKVEEDYTRTPSLIEKFSSTMMEIPWDNMDADDEVPARNLVFVGEYLTPRHTGGMILYGISKKTVLYLVGS